MSDSNSIGFRTGTSNRGLRDCSTIAQAFETAEFRDKIRQSKPEHVNPDRMLRTFVQATTKQPLLLQCDIRTFVGACLTLTQLGLEPNTPLGQAYLIPFRSRRYNPATKKRDIETVDCNVVLGYPGLIDLAYRSPVVQSIQCAVVNWGEDFDYSLGSDAFLRHRPDRVNASELKNAPPFKSFRSAYMFAKLKDGFAMEVMSYDQVMERRALSQGYRMAISARDEALAKGWNAPLAYTEAPWVKHEKAMARKTPLRSAANYLPRAVELQQGAALDELSDRRGRVRFDAAFDAEAIDGEIDYLGTTVSATEDDRSREDQDHDEMASDPPRTTVQVSKPATVTESKPAGKATKSRAAAARSDSKGEPPAADASKPAEKQPTATEAEPEPEQPQFDQPLVDGYGELADAGPSGDTFTDPVIWAMTFDELYRGLETTNAMRDAMLEANAEALEDIGAYPAAKLIVEQALYEAEGAKPQTADDAQASDPGPTVLAIPVDRGKPSPTAYAKAFAAAIAAIGQDGLLAWLDLQRPVATTLPRGQLMMVVRSVVQACSTASIPLPEWVSRVVGQSKATERATTSSEPAQEAPHPDERNDHTGVFHPESDGPPMDGAPYQTDEEPVNHGTETPDDPHPTDREMDKAAAYVGDIERLQTKFEAQEFARQGAVIRQMRMWQQTRPDLFAIVDAALARKLQP